MNKSKDFQPDWASVPGNTILDLLEEKNISIKALADQMERSLDFIEDLLKGVVGINENIARKLEDVLGSTSNFWLNRQIQFDNSLKIIESEKTQNWIKSLPINQLIKSGWITDKGSNILNELFNFFDVTSIDEWRMNYSLAIEKSNFRTSSTFDSEFSTTAAWLRMGEIIGTSQNCKNWNKEKFIQNLDKIKELTRIKSPNQFIPKLIEYCTDCGVAIAILPTPKGCRASGATRFLSENKALMMLSFRYLSDDHFWFTFFHEAGHLILHEDKQNTYLETLDRNSNQSEKELEANIFAGEALVPYNYHGEMRNLRSNKRRIVKFAMQQGISPGIVVGQMQFHGIVKPEYLNSYKRRYNWEEINAISNEIKSNL